MRIGGLFAVCILVAAGGVASAQEQVPAAAPGIPDSSTQNVVTAFSVKSGKIALSSAANPGPVYLPDGTYTNQSNTIIVIVDGRITRIQSSSGAITEINSVHLSRQRGILLTPSTNALMMVSDITLPSGTFKSEDGTASIRIVASRPTDFTLAASPEKN